MLEHMCSAVLNVMALESNCRQQEIFGKGGNGNLIVDRIEMDIKEDETDVLASCTFHWHLEGLE